MLSPQEGNTSFFISEKSIAEVFFLGGGGGRGSLAEMNSGHGAKSAEA